MTMETDQLLAQYHKLAEGNDKDQLEHVLSMLEDIRPKTEAEWRKLHEFFATSGRRSWTEIMFRRFLAVEPFNLPALLEEAEYLSEAPVRHEEAIEKARILETLPISGYINFFKMGKIYTNCWLPDPAEKWLLKASDAAREDYRLQIQIIHCLISIGKRPTGYKQLLALRESSENNLNALLAVIALSLRLMDIELSENSINRAFMLIPPEDHTSRGRLFIYAAQLRRKELLLQIAASTDFSRISSVTLLDQMFNSIETKPFFEIQSSIVNAALKLDANHIKFGKRLKSLSSSTLPTAPHPSEGTNIGISPPRGGKSPENFLSRLRRPLSRI
jgi:hypothetical protein